MIKPLTHAYLLEPETHGRLHRTHTVVARTDPCPVPVGSRCGAAAVGWQDKGR